MPRLLDIDQLHTFVKIVDAASFTAAAQQVHKTQSAVSMQMRRLEERLGRQIFVKDGRRMRLTEDGERLLSYARRMVRLNDETVAAFESGDLEGRVRFGTPDDYAERFLPEIIARFSAAHPRVDVSVLCAPTDTLFELLDKNELDLAMLTYVPGWRTVNPRIIRKEPLLWVGSKDHAVHERDPLPLALGQPSCDWRRQAVEALARVGREHRILFSSWNASAVIAAVQAGLALTVLPEAALRPELRVYGEADGFPTLHEANISTVRARGADNALIEHLEEFVAASLKTTPSPSAFMPLAAE